MVASKLPLLLERILEKTAPPGLASAYLFGSHAEHRAHRESDVDLGLLLRRETHATRADRFEEQLRLASSIGPAVGTSKLDIVVLNDAPPLLARRIVTSGIRVFCADRDIDHAFVRDVQLRAADLEPFLRRTRRSKLAALAR